jgi:hypothetical protein
MFYTTAVRDAYPEVFTFIVLPLYCTLRIWSTIIRQSTACDPCVEMRIVLLSLLALI